MSQSYILVKAQKLSQFAQHQTKNTDPQNWENPMEIWRIFIKLGQISDKKCYPTAPSPIKLWSDTNPYFTKIPRHHLPIWKPNKHHKAQNLSKYQLMYLTHFNKLQNTVKIKNLKKNWLYFSSAFPKLGIKIIKRANSICCRGANPSAQLCIVTITKKCIF